MKTHIQTKGPQPSISYIYTVASLLIMLSLSLLPLQTAQSAGTVLYARPGGMISGTCADWTHACDLQYILSSSISGVEIWAKAGTYKPTTTSDRSISFILESSVAIYGGFAGTETSRSQRNPTTNVTILSGDIGSAGNNDNSYHVVVAGSDVDKTAILDGFTISAGNANGSSDDSYGGGISNEGSPTLSNLIFSNNSATYGGGMYSYESIYSANPTLTGVTFSNNTATSYGGGIDNDGISSLTLTNVIFNDNHAGYLGGGIYNNGNNVFNLTGVTFSNNSANIDSGGGMFNDDGSSGTLENVTFSNNTATSYGGGMYDLGNVTLTDVNFNGNIAGASGGGLFDTVYCDAYQCYRNASTLANVTFNNNQAATDGGGIYTEDNLTLTGASFNGDSAGGMGGGIDSVYQITLNDASFIANTANQGGGLYCFVNDNDNTTLSNVTFSSNSATADGGGMYDYPGSNGSLSLTNTTFHSNSAQRGGGMYNLISDSITISDSILWGNNASSSGAQIYNDSSTSTITYSDVQSGCPAGSTCLYTFNLNPLLGSLGDYGGGMQVFPLLPGSPAIDAGENSSCAFYDQRGISRPQGLHCDMGAFESQGFTLAITGGSPQITRLNTNFPAPLALSVNSAHGEPVNGGQITFTAPSSGASATLSSTSVTIAVSGASVTARADGVAGTYTVTANATGAASPVAFNLTNSLNVFYVYTPLIMK